MLVLKCLLAQVKLGTFNTAESFWRHFAFLQSPEQLPRDHDLFLMRQQFIPAWESFPGGGSWCALRARVVLLLFTLFHAGSLRCVAAMAC